MSSYIYCMIRGQKLFFFMLLNVTRITTRINSMSVVNTLRPSRCKANFKHIPGTHSFHNHSKQYFLHSYRSRKLTRSFLPHITWVGTVMLPIFSRTESFELSDPISSRTEIQYSTKLDDSPQVYDHYCCHQDLFFFYSQQIIKKFQSYRQSVDIQ